MDHGGMQRRQHRPTLRLGAQDGHGGRQFGLGGAALRVLLQAREAEPATSGLAGASLWYALESD
jgi:hypothetical protein